MGKIKVKKGNSQVKMEKVKVQEGNIEVKMGKAEVETGDAEFKLQDQIKAAVTLTKISYKFDLIRKGGYIMPYGALRFRELS